MIEKISAEKIVFTNLSELKQPKKIEFFGNYTRFVILFISILCLTCMISNSLAMNFSIICINKTKTALNIADSVQNLTKKIEDGIEHNGKFLIINLI